MFHKYPPLHEVGGVICLPPSGSALVADQESTEKREEMMEGVEVPAGS